jgi:hypothetical protein
MHGRTRVAPEKAETIVALFCLFSMATTRMGVVMRTKIYALRDETRFVRYVGKTIKPLEERLQGHIRDALQGIKNHRCHWIRSLLSKKIKPIIALITEVDGDGCAAEIAYIRFFRKHGINLTNGTEGGQGGVPTEATREKIRRALVGKHGTRRGMHCSEEHKRKIGLANKGKRRTKKQIQEMSLVRLGKTPWNKGKKLLPTQYRQGYKHSPVTLSKLRDGRLKGRTPWNKGIHLSLEHRKHCSDGYKKYLLTHIPNRLGKRKIK